MSDASSNEVVDIKTVNDVVNEAVNNAVNDAVNSLVQDVNNAAVNSLVQDVNNAAEVSKEKFEDIELVEKIFSNIVQESLINETIKNKLIQTHIDISPEIIEIIKKILSVSPDCFNDIEKATNIIIKDGKIDSKDIPQFMIIIQNIYRIIYSLKDSKVNSKNRSEITKMILKYTLRLLVLERKIKIEEDKQTDFLADCDNLIDACIDLLNFQRSVRTKGCLKKIFSKKM